MPALNEEGNLKSVIEQLPQKINGIGQILVLVVNDGSTDETAKVAVDCGVELISHDHNKGVGSAFHTAVQFALEKKVDILVGIDADRQFNAKQIKEIIRPILDGAADMVTGNRFSNGMPQNMPVIKYWGNKQMSRLITLISGQKFVDVSCGFRAYNRETLLRLNLMGAFTYTQETILDIVFKGLRVTEFPVDVIYDKKRKSRVASNVVTYAFKTTNIILRTLRDYKPLVFFGGLGAISVGIGLLFELFMFIHYFVQGMFTPYKSFGFFGLGFIIFGFLLIIVGLLADMFNRVRINQERILYELKKDRYG